MLGGNNQNLLLSMKKERHTCVCVLTIDCVCVQIVNTFDGENRICNLVNWPIQKEEQTKNPILKVLGSLSS